MKTIGVTNCGPCLLSWETDNDFLRNLSRSFPKQSMEELIEYGNDWNQFNAQDRRPS